MLALALLDDRKLDKRAAPTVSKLAEEAKRMQASIASDLASIASLSKAGRLHEAGLIMSALKPVIAEDDPRVAAASAQIENATARPDDKMLDMASLKAGSDSDIDFSKAESADDLNAMDAAKQAAEQAARKAAYTWTCLTPKAFVPDGKNKTPGDDALPADQATKWKVSILETRDNAPDGWEQPGFDDSNWMDAMHPISWHLNHSALQRATFTVDDKDAYDLLKFRSWVFRQQDVAIYLNGNLIGRINNIENKTGTIENEFKPAATKYLKNGENTLAVATRQNWRWGMLFMKVYNGGFDFMLFGGQTE